MYSRCKKIGRIILVPFALYCSLFFFNCKKQSISPPLTPDEALETFYLADENLKIELVASEPLVQDPVAIAFDEAQKNNVPLPVTKMVDGFYQELESKCERLTQGLQQAADDAGVTFSTRFIGGMFGLFFSEQPANSFDDLTSEGEALYKKFFHEMLNRGVYLAPSAYEAGFISSKHDDDLIDATIKAAQESFKAL